MCRSIKTSVTTFLVSAACMAAVIALRPTKEMKYMAVFVLTFSSMQLADALIWYGIQTNNRRLNAIASKYIVPLILSAELIVAYYAAVYFLGWKNTLYEITMWALVVALYGTWIRDCLKDPVTKPNADGYLVWCNDVEYTSYARALFLIYLLLPAIIAYPNGIIKAATIAIALGTWLWNYGNTAFGSRWCWSSNLVSVAVLALVLLGVK